MNYSHIASKILSRPLLLEAQYAAVFFSAFGTRAGFESLMTSQGILDKEGMKKTAESYQLREARFGQGKYTPYAVKDGVAVISIEGSLADKTGNLEPESGMTGYDGIKAKLDMALSDSSVKGVLLNVDSPGGMVSGAFDLADTIKAAKAIKPVWSYAGDTAASAAYLLASQASKMYGSQTSSVGSIGVIVAHKDMSQRMENEGIKVTLISSGKHKTDGHPYGALPDGVKEEMQSEIDDLRDKFAGYVADGRGMNKQSILDTEARVYPATKAVEMGLMDGVASFDKVLSLFSETFARSGEKQPRGAQMSDQLKTSPGLTDAEVEKMMDMAKIEGQKLGAANERARIMAVLTHAESDGREATAKHLAFATDMTAEAAGSLMATLPKTKPISAFPMGITEAADVKAEAESTKTSETEFAEAAAVAAFAKMGIKI